ncbi:Uncharacterised protein [Mycobacteroides abscessus subsp. abscessus]|nr:Uncharacterised protein [Mycobacteroides abscessus subsp. abscessus]
MVGDPRDSQPTYGRNKLEMWGANALAGALPPAAVPIRWVDPGGGAEKYVNSLAVAIRSGC